MAGPVKLTTKFRANTIEDFASKYGVDISQGGMFIRTKRPLPVGTRVKFNFTLQGGASILKGMGTVVWIREYDPARPTVAPGMGLRFDELDQDSEQNLSKILKLKGEGAPKGQEEITSPGIAEEKTRVAAKDVLEELRKEISAKLDEEEEEKTPVPAKDMEIEEEVEPSGGEEEKKEESDEKPAEEPAEEPAAVTPSPAAEPEKKVEVEKKAEPEKVKEATAQVSALPPEEEEGGSGAGWLLFILILLLLGGGGYYYYMYMMGGNEQPTPAPRMEQVQPEQPQAEEQQPVKEATAQAVKEATQPSEATPLEAKKEEKKATCAPDQVMVRLTSSPEGAKIIIDGKEVGQTPFEGCIPKTNKIVFQKDHYKPLEKKVSLNEMKEIHVNLAWYPHELFITSRPKRALVTVDGKDRGPTSVVIKTNRPQELWKISIKKKGYKPVERIVRLEDEGWRLRGRGTRRYYRYELVVKLHRIKGVGGAAAPLREAPEPSAAPSEPSAEPSAKPMEEKAPEMAPPEAPMQEEKPLIKEAPDTTN